MRFLILFAALLLSPSLFAQLTVDIKPTRKQYISYEGVKVNVTMRNLAGRDLQLKNTPLNGGWIEFTVRNQSGRVVHSLKRKVYSPLIIPTGESVKSTFTLNNSYSLDQPGNYSVYAIVRMPNESGSQGTRSSTAYFTVNRGAVKWRSKVGVPGAAGDEREYRIISSTAGPNSPSELYVQVEDVKRSRILATYSMGRYISFRKPQQAIDRDNNLNVFFLVSPELHCHTVVNPQGKTIKRKYLKSIGSSHPTMITQADGSIYISGAKIYNREKERQENAKFHNLSELPGGFTQ